MTTKGPLGTAARYGYHGGAGPQVPGLAPDQASEWKLATLTWGSAGNAAATVAPQTPWGSFGLGWRGHEGDPRDGAKLGRKVLPLAASSPNLFAGLGWSWGYDGGVRLATAAAGAGDLEGRGPPPGSGAETFRYTYGPGDELERIVREATGQIAELETGDYGRILSRNGLPFTHDGTGRRLEDDRARYTFDWRGDLVAATIKDTWPDEDGDGEGEVTPWAGHQIREVRDATGRLAERWHYGRLPEGSTDDAQRPFIEKRTYVWEGERLAAEVATNADGTVLRWRTTYVPGPTGLDDAPQVTVEVGDQPGPFANTTRTYTLVRDELGSVIAVVAEDEGTDPTHPPVVARVSYTPYGEAHVESGPEFQRGRFDGEKTAAREGTAAGALVTQTIGDPQTAASGALVLDWSLSLDASSLVAGLSVEKLVTGPGWVALSPEEFVVGPEPEDGGISSGGGGPPARLLVLTKQGWKRGASYRVRLSPQLRDQFGRSFARTESLEWRVPEGAAAVAFDKKIPTRFESWEAASDTLGGRFPGGLSILFQGLLHDRVTGLAYARARHLDSRTASFLEEDPLLDVDSVNRYSFVAWQPNMATDPMGLCSAWEIATNQKGCWGYFVEGWNEGWREDKQAVSTTISFAPGLGDIKDVQEAITGVDLVTGEKLGRTQRAITVAAAFVPFVGGAALREGVELGIKQGAKRTASGTAEAASRALPSARSNPWNSFQRETAGDFTSRADAAEAWRAYKRQAAPASDYANRMDYSRDFLDDLRNFNPGFKHHAGRLEEDFVLVQFHRGDRALGQGRTAKWWTSTTEANDLQTLDEVRERLALPPDWGPRDTVSLARIPAGTEVEFFAGTASKQFSKMGVIFPGRGAQLRFRNFDPRWIVETRSIP